MGRNTKIAQNALRLAGMTAALAVASACTPITRYHGYTPSESELATVQVGQTTRDTVVQTFGPPTSQGAVSSDNFYYVSSQFRHFGAMAPQEVNRQILAISFGPNDRVSNVARYTLDDGRIVVLDRRVTDDGIADVSALSQLFNSLGRVDAADLFGGNQ